MTLCVLARQAHFFTLSDLFFQEKRASQSNALTRLRWYDKVIITITHILINKDDDEEVTAWHKQLNVICEHSGSYIIM